MGSQPPAGQTRQSPSLAALLSFIWPGLGQLYSGRRAVAALFALPAIVAILALLFELRRGFAVLAARFLSTDFALSVLVLVVLLGAWRAISVALAYAGAGSRQARGRRGERVALGLLLVAVLGMHTVGAYYAWSFYDFDNRVFTADMTDPGAQATPGPGQSAGPAVTIPPVVTPAPGSNRLTILLTGVDSAAGRSEHLNDTLLVVSIDTEKQTAALLSVPRDSAGFPYYWGGQADPTFKINALMTFVQAGWIKSPDDPQTTLAKEVGYLVGIPINYFGTIDLAGFAGMIDRVGGVDINNPRLIDDPLYDWLDKSPPGFTLSAGPHHLNGRLALAYVRSRQGVGDSDYTRSSRQQEVLVSLGRKLASPSMAVQLPGLLQAASKVVRTNFPSGRIADLVEFGQSMPQKNISKYVLGSPYSLSNATPSAGTWTSCLRLDRVAALSVQLFGQDSRYYGKTQPKTCAS